MLNNRILLDPNAFILLLPNAPSPKVLLENERHSTDHAPPPSLEFIRTCRRKRTQPKSPKLDAQIPQTFTLGHPLDSFRRTRTKRLELSAVCGCVTAKEWTVLGALVPQTSSNPPNGNGPATAPHPMQSLRRSSSSRMETLLLQQTEGRNVFASNLISVLTSSILPVSLFAILILSDHRSCESAAVWTKVMIGLYCFQAACTVAAMIALRPGAFTQEDFQDLKKVAPLIALFVLRHLSSIFVGIAGVVGLSMLESLRPGLEQSNFEQCSSFFFWSAYSLALFITAASNGVVQRGAGGNGVYEYSYRYEFRTSSEEREMLNQGGSGDRGQYVFGGV
uniref:Uncharacterized protein n=1 Tax=Chromera velia CCMP2878 TaxID=1169474 RepID=A0A0G4G908_9ALVE|eukprot:Cvel_20805.t1-p1 / transcript=Cvel_20805.t1 / gene=Cvel_20805 / organism=Chromera_velia_CCMP2878 / gene_product=hypothetical protein / transcript_product=hypothetical protein / location=Cvel_scaffold1900:27995-34584(+) / protein_length=334 / sequence_SO=supercontig / SO=protein_coding / is_pseudo=false